MTNFDRIPKGRFRLTMYGDAAVARLYKLDHDHDVVEVKYFTDTFHTRDCYESPNFFPFVEYINSLSEIEFLLQVTPIQPY